MKFCIAILAFIVGLSDPVYSFGGFRSSAFNGATRFTPQSVSTRSRGGLLMSLADLEDKLLGAPKSSTPTPTNVKTTTEKPKVVTPKVEKPKIEKPVAKISPKTIESPKKELPKTSTPAPKIEPPKPVPKKVAVPKAPVVPAEPANVPIGVALGAAPLVALPLLALAAGRGTLTKTVARRDQIQKEIEAVEKKKRAKFNPQTDSAGIAKASAFLGGAAASLALILAAPFSEVKEFKPAAEAPKPVKQEVVKTIVKAKKAAVEKKEEKAPAGPASGGIAARTFARRATDDAKIAQVKAREEKAAADTAEKVKALKEAEAQEKLVENLLKKAEKDVIIKEAEAKSAEAKAFAAKTPKAKAQADTIAAEKDEVALAAEAREKALKKAEVIAAADVEKKEKAVLDAELKEQAIKKKEAEALAEAAAKEKAAVEAATKALLEEKAAAAAKEKAAAEAAAKARLEEKAVAEVKAAAEAKVATSKVATPPAPVETKSSAVPSTEKASGFGVVSGEAKGGKVLPAETLDLSTLDFLRKQ